jgi:uncharacterized protein (DUF1697 family)
MMVAATTLLIVAAVSSRPATTILAAMPRYAAFLRGVSAMNAKMPQLKAAAGFDEVKTVLSTGNVVFTATRAAPPALERKAEAAMLKHLGG